MTCQTHISTKVSLIIILGKDMFTLTFHDLENETSISIWEIEMMNVIQQYFWPHFSSLHY